MARNNALKLCTHVTMTNKAINGWLIHRSNKKIWMLLTVERKQLLAKDKKQVLSKTFKKDTLQMQ